MSAPSSSSLIDLHVMWSRLIAVVEEQAQVLIRTAFSPIVRECGDLSAGVFDLQGRMLAQAITGAPGHVNTMAESVGHFLRYFPLETMRPGDAFITNDPWMGTGHLNDFVVATPCFKNGRPVGLFACTSHLMDIGGLGLGPDATDVFMEGLYIPPLKLFDQGVVNDTLITMICSNTRQPVETRGDTYALAACNDIGCRRLVEMMEEFNLESLDELAGHIIERSREAVLAEVRKLPRGTWYNTMTIDGYHTPVVLSAALTVTGSGIHVDYKGSSPQSDRGINVPVAYAAAYTMYALACAVAGKIPNNAGSLSVFSVSAPVGTIVNAPRPAPVSARHVVGQMLPDVTFGCLLQIIPGRIPAEGASCLYALTMRGEMKDGAAGKNGFTLGFTCNGGTGARPDLDGLSATAFPTNVKGAPVEISEAQTPLIFWRKELREASGGAGRTRGGLGQVIEVESAIDKPFQILAAFDRIAYGPRGRDGGHDGATGYIGLKSGRCLSGKGAQDVPRGERLVVMTPGGAGLGSPHLRSPQRVEDDLRDELISQSFARETYPG